jgi:hypothetical protein
MLQVEQDRQQTVQNMLQDRLQVEQARLQVEQAWLQDKQDMQVD